MRIIFFYFLMNKYYFWLSSMGNRKLFFNFLEWVRCFLTCHGCQHLRMCKSLRRDFLSSCFDLEGITTHIVHIFSYGCSFSTIRIVILLPAVLVFLLNKILDPFIEKNNFFFFYDFWNFFSEDLCPFDINVNLQRINTCVKRTFIKVKNIFFVSIKIIFKNKFYGLAIYENKRWKLRSF